VQSPTGFTCNLKVAHTDLSTGTHGVRDRTRRLSSVLNVCLTQQREDGGRAVIRDVISLTGSLGRELVGFRALTVKQHYRRFYSSEEAYESCLQNVWSAAFDVQLMT
jgi:hypothetical protein